MMKYILPCLLIAGLLLSSCSDSDSGNHSFNKVKDRNISFTDSLAFISSEGDTLVTIAIAVADDTTERRRGLMYFTDLEQDEGMLFIFQREQPREFWMANTPLSLDIIFVNAEKEIVRIHHSTPPFSKQNFKSGVPILYAIEVNAGFTIAHDIHEGTEVRFDLSP